MSTFQRSKILIVQQSVGQTAYVCKKYPAADTRETMRKAMELVRSEVANPALFMRMAIKWRIAPKTEVVEKTKNTHGSLLVSQWSLSRSMVVKW